MDNQTTLVIIGATGLVGSHVLNMALESQLIKKVIAYSRKPLPAHPKLKVIIDELSQIHSHLEDLKGTHYVCALGTTIKVAKTRSAFEAVDDLAVYEFARVVKHQEGKLAVISSLGADPDSLVYYSRVKGQMELKVQNLLGNQVRFFRPSLLVGDRKHSRFAENFGALLRFLPIWIGPLKRYRPIEAEKIAAEILQWVIADSSKL